MDKKRLVQIFDKDGALNGWVVSGMFTLVTIVMLILGLVNGFIADAWVKIGSTYATIYISSLGIWFGYKTIKSFSGGGVTTTQ
jgi:hypothetical protein